MKNYKPFILIGLALTLLLVLWADLYHPRWLELTNQLLPPRKVEAPLRTRGNIENLLVAVAPMSSKNHPEKDGMAVRDKIALHMEKDLGLKVLRLTQPVSMGPKDNPDLAEGYKNAEMTIADSGADLLVWGDDNDTQGEDKWNIYVTTSVQARCLAREEGYTMLENTDLSRVEEGDMLNVLDWVTSSWRGLIDRSRGMYIAQTMGPMIKKINTILGLVAEKRMSDDTRSAVKSNLAFLLAEYGNETMDIPSLQNAVRLSEDVISGGSSSPELRNRYEDLEADGVLAKCLFRLGSLRNDHEKLREAETVIRRSLKMVDKKDDPQNWAVLQIELGLTLEFLGHRTGDLDKIHEAVDVFEGAQGIFTQESQPSQWRSLQTGLAGAYFFLGSRGTDNAFLKKALELYQSMEARDTHVLAPSDYATVETNLGSIYAILGQRDKSAPEIRQAILHSDKAVSQCHAMGDLYGEGFALSAMGQAQYLLGEYTQDDALLARSLQAFKRSQELVPQTQDLALWVKCQINSANCRQFMALKKFDQAELQAVLKIIEDLKPLFDRQASRPMWTEVNLYQANTEAILGNVDCKAQSQDEILSLMKEIRPGLDPQKDVLQLDLVDITTASALNTKGSKLNDPAYIRQAIPLLEAGLAKIKPGDVETLVRSYRDALVSAYANLILKGGGPPIPIDRAQEVLDDFEKEGMDTPVVVDEANHYQNFARLERALASLDKDKTRLAKARPMAEKAYRLFKTNGYEFMTALAQKELAEQDLLAGQLNGDPAVLRQAVEEFKSAKKALDTYADCWDESIQKNIAQAEK
jgi:tetratricopeptide (TPR) repeat protein